MLSPGSATVTVTAPCYNPDDYDGDGIKNSSDKCPFIYGTVANDGCN